MTRPFRLDLGQSPAELNPLERLNWLDTTLLSVDVDLIVLPELFATGYNIGDALQDAAEPVDGPILAAMSALAHKHQTAIHSGLPDAADGVIYNAALCVAPNGKVLSHQRKLAIPPGFERDIFTAGQGCNLFTYCGLKIATLICYDAEFSETVRHVAGLGAQLVLVPTALGDQWGWAARTMLPTRAYENGVFLAHANSAGIENNLSFLGESVIAAPNGVELARAGAAPEILTADIAPNRVTAAQLRLPYLLDRRDLALD